mmetsp:Transcript_7781/g.28216  ORF Transcript_7781/g.28216 Transcript_7781/m.28216 type:complete len:329 (+) Transcript_7781:40-1026(+)
MISLLRRPLPHSGVHGRGVVEAARHRVGRNLGQVLSRRHRVPARRGLPVVEGVPLTQLPARVKGRGRSHGPAPAPSQDSPVRRHRRRVLETAADVRHLVVDLELHGRPQVGGLLLARAQAPVLVRAPNVHLAVPREGHGVGEAKSDLFYVRQVRDGLGLPRVHVPLVAELPEASLTPGVHVAPRVHAARVRVTRRHRRHLNGVLLEKEDLPGRPLVLGGDEHEALGHAVPQHAVGARTPREDLPRTGQAKAVHGSERDLLDAVVREKVVFFGRWTPSSGSSSPARASPSCSTPRRRPRPPRSPPRCGPSPPRCPSRSSPPARAPKSAR